MNDIVQNLTVIEACVCIFGSILISIVCIALVFEIRRKGRILFDLMVERLERQESGEAYAPKWISVKDRLPEEGVDVLCYYDGRDTFGVTMGAYYPHVVLFWGAWDLVDNPRDAKVLYWMYMPDMPKQRMEG